MNRLYKQSSELKQFVMRCITINVRIHAHIVDTDECLIIRIDMGIYIDYCLEIGIDVIFVCMSNKDKNELYRNNNMFYYCCSAPNFYHWL